MDSDNEYDDYGDCGVDQDDDYDYEEENVLSKMSSQLTLVWKTSQDIFQIIDFKVRDQMECLNLSFDDTLILYRYFSWNKDKMEQEYFLRPE